MLALWLISNKPWEQETALLHNAVDAFVVGAWQSLNTKRSVENGAGAPVTIGRTIFYEAFNSIEEFCVIKQGLPPTGYPRHWRMLLQTLSQMTSGDG